MAFRSNNVFSRGFTLIELMVVVGVIAFVTAATIPSFLAALLQNRQREAASLIVQAIFTARSSAPRAGSCFRVTVVTNTTGLAGGTGGSVQVDQYFQPTADCGTPSTDANAADWIPVSFYSVGGDANHARLVGNDIAIFRVLGPGPNCAVAANPVLFFNPDGTLYVAVGAVALDTFFEVDAFQSDGVTQIGQPRQVRVSASGVVNYTLCR